ncbi:MAG: hypothetical protein AAGJ73_07295 [Pseudomonadota bacterium]
MSHNVYFFNGRRRPISLNSVVAYFSDRAYWSVDADAAQVAYLNSDTHVSFVARIRESGASNACLEIPKPSVAFQVNYFRPPFFGDEAAIELSAFREFFDPEFVDPQAGVLSSNDTITYFSNGFLSHYRVGNAKAYVTIIERLREEGGAIPPCVAETKLMDAWRWNRLRKPSLEKYFRDSGQDVCVASSIWATIPEEGGRPLCVATWTDGARAAIPTFVDRIILIADGIRRRRRGISSLLFRSNSEATMCMVHVDDVAGLNCASAKTHDNAPYIFVDSDVSDPPREVIDLYRRPQPPLSESFQVTPSDEILSADLMAEARSNAKR